ncbi:uncharacterized protein FIBRA_05660 [Fibroporia radiculosa]|uniref:Uncharacterized protein n=1 Tax=Fibroporia radiculosa TaxID=599839 RepID=J4IAU6_9APHY|nr:uncharacterized protein FIBRA_05660 [Fibroporia radiculosa]CCM03526.1 predicted protein [Fibroporia radiculosa]
MSPTTSSDPRTAIVSPGEITTRLDKHQHHRRFIGPLPKQTAFPGKHFKDLGVLSSSDSDYGPGKLIRQLAYEFFLVSGGVPEAWNEEEERRIQDKMYKRWAESDWGEVYLKRAGFRRDKSWVGTSFDIGYFLGISISDTKHSCGRSVATPFLQHAAASGVSTFVTAPSHLSPIPDSPATFSDERPVDGEQSSGRAGYDTQSISSSTALINASKLRVGPAQLRSGGPSRPSVGLTPAATRSILGVSTSESAPNGAAIKGKGKMVHYSQESVDDYPVSPGEVLNRTGEAVEHTSAGAAQQADIEGEVGLGNFDMRDRMFVKFAYTEADSLPAHFDEGRNRTASHLYSGRWAEYVVIWRKDRLELYRAHSFPGKDWYTGHMKLAHVIPLGDSSPTRLSLYSFIDMTFCLICPPATLRKHSKRRWLYRRTRGLNVFIFKIRSHTRAVDWVWKLWRHLGGRLPSSLEIHAPALGTRIRVNVPGADYSKFSTALAVFDRQNLLRLCLERLRKVKEYDFLIGQKLASGAKLALAWRLDTKLDWVRHVDDIQGSPRKWAVLCGLALNQGSKSAHLEVRLREHLPTRLHTKDGMPLDEPPAVEGYLERIRSNPIMKQPVYLATHDGYLFTVPIAHAHQPIPPGVIPPDYDPSHFRQDEVRRGTQQILHATGMTDLRSVLAVRRAFQLVPRNVEDISSLDVADGADDQPHLDTLDGAESDDNDLGGETGLNAAFDKSRLHMKRSFELLLVTGKVVRYEAHSCEIALEWVSRLRTLIIYWRRRHHVDTQKEMRLAHASTGKARITPRRLVEQHDAPPEPLPDPEAFLPELSSFFNWLAGVVQLVLVSGSLIQYRITTKNSLHHHRGRTISLLDACIWSGFLAAQYLPEDQHNPDAPQVARRYQDGLETTDGLEDTLFMLWYRSSSKARGGVATAQNRDDIPQLSMKRKVIVFRTRSKLERDAWVWAINAEIEKIVRATADREDRIRNTGHIVET